MQSQASSEARIARLEAAQEETNRQLAETNRQLDSFADTQAALMQVATETFAAQNRVNAAQNGLNEDLRRGLDELRRGQENLQLTQEAVWAAFRQSSVRQDRTEAIVERLAETVRSHIEGGGGNLRG